MNHPDFTGTATVAGLVAGDTVSLHETSAGSRVLSILHVLKMTEQQQAGSTVGGGCQRGEWTEFGLCPATAQLPVDSQGDPSYELDDRSGGKTVVSVGSLANFAPADDSSVASSGFEAFVDLAGFSSPAAVVAQTGAVNFSLAPYPNGKTIFAHDMTLNASSKPAFASIVVPAITPTRYIAHWTLTDINGDTNQFQTQLVAQPSTIMPPPSKTDDGHTGKPAGPQSTQGKVCWSVRVSERQHPRARTCRELVIPAGVGMIRVTVRAASGCGSATSRPAARSHSLTRSTGSR